MMDPRRSPPESFPRSTWRLLFTGRRSGAANMALDVAIATAVAAGDSPPTLRLYGFDPPALSLGAGQSPALADLGRCAARGWEVVRRPGEGRAMLHVDELSFSIALPAGEPRLQPGPESPSQRIGRGLAAGLGRLGIEPGRVRTYYEQLGAPGEAAFDGLGDEEITVGPHTLIARGQAWIDGAWLQQGMLPLVGDVTRVADALFVDLPGQRLAIAARLRFRAASLLLIAGQRYALDEAAPLLADGLATALNLELVTGSLSEAETAAARNEGRFRIDE